ncbi:MAG TPA: tetratricopeptide repeat protein [Bryobacteraceae bacterium]|jgi:Flp pilus assembly protein TadD|nr:tetratricopeptide repeat protein [Bryobacteraceae bacterium]
MKKQKRPVTKAAEQPAPAAVSWLPPWWTWLIGLGSLFLVFEAYGPALHSAFVLDDVYLPYADVDAPRLHLTDWLRYPRPLLMFSYWLNYQSGAEDPHVYHTTNVLLHFLVSTVVLLIAWRLLEWVGVSGRMRTALAVFAGGLFLLHPLQTESVAYVASRSEVLSVLFYYSAFAVFIYSNRDRMSWLRAISIVVLFGAAAATKEHTLTLPVLILLTDFFWHRGGMRKNAVLYGLLAVACAAGGVVVGKVLFGANTAGFNLKDLSPVSYFFTQCRVVWIYVRMFFLPYGQNVDPDVALSTGPAPAAIFGLIAMLAVAVAAWVYRKRWPLASFGVFVFLLLIAPTSSVIPIRDVLAERRVYLPFLGLILIVLEPLRRLRFEQAVGASAAVLVACTVLTYQRSDVWSTPLNLWQDSVAKSPGKVRPRFQLAFAQFRSGDCAAAVKNFDAASRLAPPDYLLLVDWANALDCAGRETDAIGAFARAIELNGNRPEAYVGLSAIYGKQRRAAEALNVLARAEAADPGVGQIYLNRGGVYEILGNYAGAIAEYRRAATIDTSNRAAREALKRLGQ